MPNQISGQKVPIYVMFSCQFQKVRSLVWSEKRPLSSGVLTGTVPSVKREFYSKTAEVARLQYAHRSIIWIRHYITLNPTWSNYVSHVSLPHQVTVIKRESKICFQTKAPVLNFIFGQKSQSICSCVHWWTGSVVITSCRIGGTDHGTLSDDRWRKSVRHNRW